MAEGGYKRLPQEGASSVALTVARTDSGRHLTGPSAYSTVRSPSALQITAHYKLRLHHVYTSQDDKIHVIRSSRTKSINFSSPLISVITTTFMISTPGRRAAVG